MHYEGSFDVAATKERVYSFMTDPRKVTTIFPDVQSVKIIDEENFALRANVGISFIRGTMDVKGSIPEKEKPRMAKLRARGTGLSSAVDLESTFIIQDGEKGETQVSWAADAKMSGMMASVGSRLIDSAVNRYVKQTIASLQKELS